MTVPDSKIPAANISPTNIPPGNIPDTNVSNSGLPDANVEPGDVASGMSGWTGVETVSQLPLLDIPLDSPPDIPLDSPPWVDLRRYDQSGFDRGRPGWMVLLWWLVQAIAFPLTLHSHHFPRRALLRLFGARIGQGVVIRPTARFTYPWKVNIGDYSWVGDDVVFYSLDHIWVGAHCVISQNTYLCTGSHDAQDPTFRLKTGAIAVGNGTWVATGCFIAPGVQIGANSVVGVRSTVLHNMPAAYVCWGIPCRPQHPREMADGSHVS